MSTIQKTVQGRGPSNINLLMIVCSFEVCRVSYSVPYNNYGVYYNSKVVFIAFLVTNTCGMEREKAAAAGGGGGYLTHGWV